MTISFEFDDRPLKYQTMNSVLENRATYLNDKAAIIYGPSDQQISFKSLNEKANSIGNSLNEIGVEKQTEVSVMMRHPLYTIFLMLGINKAGALYSPINFEYKGDTLSYQINDTSPDVLIIEDQYVERLNDVKEDLLNLPHIIVRDTVDGGEVLDDEFSQSSYSELLEGSTTKPDIEISWDDNASILYTSGTTGQPKGVLNPHRWVFANYILPRVAVLNQQDVVHTSLPFYHVTAAYYDFVAALTAGATTSVWDQFSTSAFWDRIDRYNATTVTLISVMVPWLKKKAQSDDDHRNTLNKVHMAPIPDDYQNLAKRYSFDFISTAYGSTESGASVASYVHAAKGDYGTPSDLYRGTTPDEVKRGAEKIGMPIVDKIPTTEESTEYVYTGKPIDGVMELSLRDEYDEAIETGVGEICIRPKDAGLIFQSYYNKPERTVEAWQNLWFHTGDAGYRDKNGNFYFVDRMGGVIRRRGENISSMQLEDIIGSHDSISQVAAFPVSAEEGGEDEVAIAATLIEGAEIRESDLHEYLSDRMPDFMKPRYIYFVDEMPTTGTNKISKYELKEQFE